MGGRRRCPQRLPSHCLAAPHHRAWIGNDSCFWIRSSFYGNFAWIQNMKKVERGRLHSVTPEPGVWIPSGLRSSQDISGGKWEEPRDALIISCIFGDVHFVFPSSSIQGHFQTFRNDCHWIKNTKTYIRNKWEMGILHIMAWLQFLHSFYWLIHSIVINPQLNHLCLRKPCAAKHFNEIKFFPFDTNTAILVRIDFVVRWDTPSTDSIKLSVEAEPKV